MNDLPKFDAPPISEVVISLQFDRVPALSAAHIGWYWKDCLGPERWTTVAQTKTIGDAFERFGEETEWAPLGGVRFITDPPSELRLQFVTKNQERMIQVQPSRFAYNWRKRSGEYPTFEKLQPDFDAEFSRFREFLVRSGIGSINLNQWEISYVNQIHRGDGWSLPQDWKAISTSLVSPVNVPGQQLETLECNWHFVIGDALGRVHITANHGRLGSKKGPEVLTVQLTARGPIGSNGNYHQGFDLGHRHLVLTFDEMTSDAAHKKWGRGR